MIISPHNNALSRTVQEVRLNLVGKKKVAIDVYEMRFDYVDRPLTFLPGQYIHLTVPLSYPDPRGSGRDFSIITTPGEPQLGIAMRVSGSGFKRTLLEAKTLMVTARGPLGVFTLPPVAGDPLVFISDRIGVAPFVSMLRHVTLRKLPFSIMLLTANDGKQPLPYRAELEEMGKTYPNVSFVQCAGSLTPGIITGKIAHMDAPLWYIAGSPILVVHAKNILFDLGIPAHRIREESFTGYRQEVPLGTSTRKRKLRGPVRSTIGKRKLMTGIEGELANRSGKDLEALLLALNSTAIVSETDASGTITFVNDKFTELSKYTRQELIGKNHRILKSGFHSRAFYENMWSTITRGILWRGQMKNKAKDGTFYWVDTSIAPIMEGGKPVKYISVRFPVTERQMAEERLQEQSKQQNVLTMLSQEALARDLPSLLDTATHLVSQTLSVELTFIERLRQDGKTLVYVSGTEWTRAVRGETQVSAKAHESLAGYTLAANEPVVIEDLTTEQRFSGSAILHEHNVISGAAVIIPGADRPFGVLGVFSTRKRVFSQEDIHFAQAVANLIANAARNQLDKRKDEFLGMASHELRTPLTSTKTFVQLLEKHAKDKGDEKAAVYLSKINNQIGRLTDLVSDLLDISRINTGRLEYHDEQFSLAELVEEAVSEYRMVSHKHSIRLINGLHTEIYGDRNRISQVMANLLANAGKYSPDGRTIIIRTGLREHHAVVSVQDFGVGISKEEQPHVFDRFFRGGSKKKENFPGGLGLGLYLSAEIIRRHNGRIWVESEEGKGSTFHFSLPSVRNKDSLYSVSASDRT